MKKILSIDGGGIRGIIAGEILVSIEERLQKITSNPNARIANFFDFFAGTSTGGILIAILLCPSESDRLTPRFSAREAVDLYIKTGHKIFSSDVFHDIISMKGLSAAKYESKGIDESLKKYFGELKLNELLKPCIISSYDIDERKAKFFAQHDYARKGDGSNFYVRDVCRATSAAPTYFEPKLIKSLSGVSYSCIDGGVFANNPTLCAYSEVRNARGNPTAKDMYVVSIGTGSKQQSYKYLKAKHWGEIGWVKPVIDIMMSGAAEITNYHMIKMFSAQNNLKNYQRIQPTSLKDANPQMDNISQQNIAALIDVGKETAENCPEIEDIVKVLLQGADPMIF